MMRVYFYLFILLIFGCKKEVKPLPGEEPYCIKCRDYSNVVVFDTCTTLDGCNQYEIRVKKINPKINCYYYKDKVEYERN